jgi:hypothetical protein
MLRSSHLGVQGVLYKQTQKFLVIQIDFFVNLMRSTERDCDTTIAWGALVSESPWLMTSESQHRIRNVPHLSDPKQQSAYGAPAYQHSRPDARLSKPVHFVDWEA